MQSSVATDRNGAIATGENGSTTETVVKHKIVLLGDQSVGKTSLITRFMYDTFDQQYQATIGIDFFSKTMHVDHRTVRLHVWDTAGQERFHSLIPNYIRNSTGTLVVYDITSRASFLSTFKWIDEVRRERGSDVVIILVGNKKDSQEQREVSNDEAQKKANEYGVFFMEVSARQGTNVKALFRKMVEALPAPEESGAHGGAEGANGKVLLTKQRDPFLVTPSRFKEGTQESAGGGAGTARGGCC